MWSAKLFTLFTYVILISSDIVHGKYIFREDVQRSIAQKKVVATWEDAKKRCENAGAILASPIDEKLLKHMMSYIDVNNHTNPYFIGIKAKYTPQTAFYTAEDILLDDLPDIVLDMIDTLDPHDGDCLAMNRNSIRVVPCWNRYPYICYTKPKSDEPEEAEPVKPTEAEPVKPTEAEPVKPTEAEPMKPTEAAPVTATEPVTTEAVTETTVTPECDYDGYEYYPSTGRCYRLHTTDKNWSDANVTCDDEGGYLVIVNDEEEAKTIANIIKVNYVYLGAVWVGLTDVTGNKNWRSIHGDPIDKIYNHWSENVRMRAKPNPCVYILKDGSLYDHPCGGHLAFVCEKSL